MKKARVLLVVAFVFILASCGLKPMWDVFGKWQQVGGTTTVEILQNSTVNITDGNTSVSARYNLTSPTHMQIVLGSLGAMELDLKVENGELTLTNANGEATKFQKATATAAAPAQ